MSQDYFLLIVLSAFATGTLAGLLIYRFLGHLTRLVKRITARYRYIRIIKH